MFTSDKVLEPDQTEANTYFFMSPMSSCYVCISPKTGTKHQLDAAEDVKAELTLLEPQEVEQKKAKLSHKESPTKVPLRPGKTCPNPNPNPNPGSLVDMGHQHVVTVIRVIQ